MNSEGSADSGSTEETEPTRLAIEAEDSERNSREVTPRLLVCVAGWLVTSPMTILRTSREAGLEKVKDPFWICQFGRASGIPRRRYTISRFSEVVKDVCVNNKESSYFLT